jgi:DNA-binding CsgD family transcriptional regulator
MRAGELAMSAADYANAERCSQDSMRVARTTNDAGVLALTLNQLAVLAWFRRDYPAAQAFASEGVVAAQAAGDRRLEAYTLWVEAQATFDEGDADAADRVAQAGLAISIGEGYPAGAALALTTLAQVRIRHGELRSAQRLLERSMHEHGSSNFPLGRMWTLGNLGWVHLEQRQFAEARQCFEQALAIGRDVLGGRARLAIPLEGFAQLAAATNHPVRALKLAGAAAALRASGATPAATAEQRQLSRWLGRARADLDPHVAEIAWADGQLLTAEQAIDEALGLPPENAVRRPRGDGLTAREWEVATLIGEGLGTRALAEHLVISEATVRVHVERALAKLGLHSRAQLAAWAVGRSLDVVEK